MEKNGYAYVKQKYLSPGLGGGRQRVDTLVTATDNALVNVSVKWQGGSGSVDEKVPAEILKMLVLKDANPAIKRCYIVLVGPGWATNRLKAFYKNDIATFIPRAKEVKIIELDEFMHLCIRKAL
ncbi:MAG: hypothetical protein DLM50_00010 [Candidatus Meridianibacter frigidus]|nr:MAG: hypothetical protein DLM50_00010 [Candidatus Eremiobacteraeota bacterium]